jgi:hypothetical protein
MRVVNLGRDQSILRGHDAPAGGGGASSCAESPPAVTTDPVTNGEQQRNNDNYVPRPRLQFLRIRATSLATHERGATILTSNRAIEEWPALFGDALLASAAMDRLLHHAHVIAIEGDSYRNPPPRRSGGAKASATEAPRHASA